MLSGGLDAMPLATDDDHQRRTLVASVKWRCPYSCSGSWRCSIVRSSTGPALDGVFDVDLTYSPDNRSSPGPVPLNAPSLPTAVREQLGLRLESTRAPVEVLVIDAVTPPSEN